MEKFNEINIKRELVIRGHKPNDLDKKLIEDIKIIINKRIYYLKANENFFISTLDYYRQLDEDLMSSKIAPLLTQELIERFAKIRDLRDIMLKYGATKFI